MQDFYIHLLLGAMLKPMHVFYIYRCFILMHFNWMCNMFAMSTYIYIYYAFIANCDITSCYRCGQLETQLSSCVGMCLTVT